MADEAADSFSTNLNPYGHYPVEHPSHKRIFKVNYNDNTSQWFMLAPKNGNNKEWQLRAFNQLPGFQFDWALGTHKVNHPRGIVLDYPNSSTEKSRLTYGNMFSIGVNTIIDSDYKVLDIGGTLTGVLSGIVNGQAMGVIYFEKHVNLDTKEWEVPGATPPTSGQIGWRRFSTSILDGQLFMGETVGHPRKMSYCMTQSGRPYIFYCHETDAGVMKVKYRTPADYSTRAKRMNSAGDDAWNDDLDWSVTGSIGTNIEVPNANVNCGMTTGMFNVCATDFKDATGNGVVVAYGAAGNEWRRAYTYDSSISFVEGSIFTETQGNNSAGSDNSIVDDHVVLRSYIPKGKTYSTIVFAAKTGLDGFRVIVKPEDLPIGEITSWENAGHVKTQNLNNEFVINGEQVSSSNTGYKATRCNILIDGINDRVKLYFAVPHLGPSTDSEFFISYRQIDLKDKGYGEYHVYQVEYPVLLAETGDTPEPGETFSGVYNGPQLNNPFVPMHAVYDDGGNGSAAYPVISYEPFLEEALPGENESEGELCAGPLIWSDVITSSEWTYGCKNTDSPGKYPDIENYCSFGFNQDNYTTANGGALGSELSPDVNFDTLWHDFAYEQNIVNADDGANYVNIGSNTMSAGYMWGLRNGWTDHGASSETWHNQGFKKVPSSIPNFRCMSLDLKQTQNNIDSGLPEFSIVHGLLYQVQIVLSQVADVNEKIFFTIGATANRPFNYTTQSMIGSNPQAYLTLTGADLSTGTSPTTVTKTFRTNYIPFSFGRFDTLFSMSFTDNFEGIIHSVSIKPYVCPVTYAGNLVKETNDVSFGGACVNWKTLENGTVPLQDNKAYFTGFNSEAADQQGIQSLTGNSTYTTGLVNKLTTGTDYRIAFNFAWNDQGNSIPDPPLIIELIWRDVAGETRPARFDSEIVDKKVITGTGGNHPDTDGKAVGMQFTPYKGYWLHQVKIYMDRTDASFWQEGDWFSIDDVQINQVTGTGFKASNVNQLATTDDGLCKFGTLSTTVYEESNEWEEIDIYGCMDPESLNYNPYATVDDGSCEYPGDGDGSGDGSQVSGCTDPNAINYNPNATIDNGTCEYEDNIDDDGNVIPDEDTDDPVQPQLSVEHIYNLLNTKLGDERNDLFKESEKLDALNKAQTYVSTLLDSGYLVELERQKTAATISGTSKGLKALGIRPLKNEVIGVFSEDLNCWANMIDYENFNDSQNSYFTASKSNLEFSCWIESDTLNVSPSQSKIDIWYIKEPRKIDIYTNSEMNPALFGLILDYAEYLLWVLDKDDIKASEAAARFKIVLDVLNGTYRVGGKSGY
ncbi:MAG: hypothetical protein Unbinned5336contig1001_19 [Prokaryotic dsDNA virus sp.]|nr:MAG: hypothetical protein Unbinned5336contig1001_19 [Prokaryotic dsDNA virus sp.]